MQRKRIQERVNRIHAPFLHWNPHTTHVIVVDLTLKKAGESHSCPVSSLESPYNCGRATYLKSSVHSCPISQTPRRRKKNDPEVKGKGFERHQQIDVAIAHDHPLSDEDHKRSKKALNDFMVLFNRLHLWQRKVLAIWRKHQDQDQ